MKVDFIIVGQGLAGTLLAFELFRNKKSFLVFDDPNLDKSSDVAAGIINPVVFRRMTKSWLVDDVFPQMEITYRQLENLLQEQFYFPNQIHRILSEDTAVFWKEKAFANRMEEYIEANPDVRFRHEMINSPFGIGRVLKAGRLDIQKLISTFSEFLQRQNLLRKEKFSFEKMLIKSDQVIYNDVTAEKIIFCEGPAVSQNPYFKNLKFKHSKGEILDLKIPELNLNEIISQEIFMLPVGNDRYKVGATYSWDQLNTQTTDSARHELLDKLKTILVVNPEILGQKAGIRPTMHDRKPVIGVLPNSPQIGIFNGLGSKGVLSGPFFARQLADLLIGNIDFIHPEASINRYFASR
ncbi:MAG TPA: FAD-binding oxidoreductase [Prolixibacteraceae bacterium]|nr:FAD-binding oxidoreductase [Prolixibacteraceae bacterium]